MWVVIEEKGRKSGGETVINTFDSQEAAENEAMTLSTIWPHLVYRVQRA